MHERPGLLIVLIFLTAMVLHVAAHALFGFSYRTPRFVTLAVVTIGLRWGSIAGGYLGALSGLLLALLSGEAPFAGTTALALAGWFAGEIPSRFVLESHRAVGLAIAASGLIELLLVCLIRWVLPPGGLNAVIWIMGWGVIVSPFFYRFIVWLSTPPPPQRLSAELE
jgi:hypothetical protein